MTLVALHDVSFAYRAGRPVIRGVSANFVSGRVTALVGPNGAGKSTLLRLVLGALAPTQGRVCIDLGMGGMGGTGERAVGGISARERARHIAYVPQHAEAGEAFTAEQVISLGRLSRPVDAGVVGRAIDRLVLAEHRRELYATLSAGQQQRVTLARALAQLDGGDVPPGRQVLLADEPCSAMDPAHMVRAMTILREEAAAGRAVVVVLHDVSAALRFADDAVVLDAEGRVTSAGAAAEVLTPGVLEAVYGVGFVRLGTVDGPVALVPLGGGCPRIQAC